MTILAAPGVNYARSTLAASFTRGTDDDIVLADGTLFPSPTPSGHVVFIHETEAVDSKFCLVIYISKAGNTLTMSAVDDYALSKNVSTGDEAHEFPIGSIVDLICAADEIAQVMAGEAAAIHDNVAAEIVAVAEKTAPVASDEFLIEDSAAGNAKKSLKIGNLTILKQPTLINPGTGITRTYKGYEIVSAVASFSVGGGGDYADLTAAFADLQGLMLLANINLLLTGNIAVGTEATIQGLIGMGGSIVLDLQTHTYELTSGSPTQMFQLKCPVQVYIKNGTIKASTTDTEPLYRLLNAGNAGCTFRLASTLTLDADNKAYRSLVESDMGSILWENPTEANVGSLTEAVARMSRETIIRAIGGDPSSMSLLTGAISVADDGTVTGGAS